MTPDVVIRLHGEQISSFFAQLLKLAVAIGTFRRFRACLMLMSLKQMLWGFLAHTNKI